MIKSLYEIPSNILLDKNNIKKINFDYAILNPPYLSIKEDNRFFTQKTKNLYAYFLENIINHSKGFISITPQSFTDGDNFNSLRELLLQEMDFIKIFCFDIVP